MKSFDGALEDIRIIKTSIGENKGSFDKIYKFLLFLGIVNLVGFMLTALGFFMFTLDDRYWMFIGNMNIVMHLLLFVYFVKVYKEEKISSNKYYLAFLNIFAGIVFLLPFLNLIMRFWVSFSVYYRDVSETFFKLREVSMTSNILLFCFILVLCGLFLKKTSMFFASAVIFLLYLIFSVVYNVPTFDNIEGGSIPLLAIYYDLVKSIGYIVVATILKKNRANVNEPN
ncbi:hypothetical protein [Dethiobacter alkaliphilus]|uniref:hypothetical protein n=1 Tax=Dethiobacter alkaliphilus TaxID=427926 RepID=UPI002227AFE1|nr:hypothetical protein [Dethiobacter alkaliphilus]MCW3491624.1 hypothetical protein [Dethiobacter alkaliphilus]